MDRTGPLKKSELRAERGNYRENIYPPFGNFRNLSEREDIYVVVVLVVTYALICNITNYGSRNNTNTIPGN